jgi:replicative DNA helicase
MDVQIRAENVILHEVLANPGDIHQLMDKVEETMFVDPTNKLVFNAVHKLYINQDPINTTSLIVEINKSKSIFSKEAVIQLSKIISFPIGHKELPDAINVLVCNSIKNEHLQLAQKVSSMTSGADYEPEKVLNFLQDHITNNKYKALINKRSYDNQSLLDELEDKMRIASESNGVSGIRTGYHEFDEITSGMQPTNLIVVAARPGAGKTQMG